MRDWLAHDFCSSLCFDDYSAEPRPIGILPINEMSCSFQNSRIVYWYMYMEVE